MKFSAPCIRRPVSTAQFLSGRSRPCGTVTKLVQKSVQRIQDLLLSTAAPHVVISRGAASISGHTHVRHDAFALEDRFIIAYLQRLLFVSIYCARLIFV